jgi:hypothetical protein
MEEEKIVNLGGVNRPIPSPGILQNPGNQVPGNSPSPRDMFLGIMKENQSTSIPNIPVSSFYTGSRYEQTRPFTDFEEMAAQQQSGFEQFRNGIGKMVGLGATSFVSGTAGLLYGIGSAASTLKFSNLYNNPVTQLMDQAQSGMEDYLPNYYKKSEQDAEWWSPDNWYTANFWGDKVFKNIGYGVGSIAGGAAWSKVFKLIGQANSLVRAGKGLEASANIEKAMSIVPKTQKLSAIESTLANLSQGARDVIKNNGDRFLVSAMGTFGEASIEALQKMNEFRNSAIEEYKNKFGYAPEGEDLDEINAFAEKAGNYVWGMNTIILTGSNYLQLPKILGSSRKVEKSFINKITQEGLGKEFVEQLPKTRFGKIADKAMGVGSLLVSPTESIEEGLQFAIATGVDDYFDRAYKNREELGSFLETVYGAMGNVFGEGIEKTLTTKEGIESLIIGSLAGSIQQAPMTIYREGLTGKGGVKAKNTAVALEQLNVKNIDSALKEQADFMAIGIGSQTMRQQAIENNDVLSEKDYEKDFTLSYLMPRAKYGKMDSVYSELDNYKQQALSGGFEELQSAGIAFDGETKEQFVQRIGNLENTARAVDKHYENINLNYAGVLQTDESGEVVKDKKGNPFRKYAPVVVDKLVYAASKIDDYTLRIPAVNAELAKAGIMTAPILQNILENNKPNKESVKEALDQINAMDVTNDTKDDLKRSLSDLIELLLRRKLFINQYNDIKQKPLNYAYFSASEKVREMGTVEVSQKEDGKTVSKSFEVGKEYSLAEPIKIENGKLTLAPKLTILSETLGGEFEVRLPDGREAFLSPLEFKTYNISEEDNTSEEFKNILDQSIDDVLEYPAFRDVFEKPGKDVNKIEYINSLSNQKLTKAVINRFNKLAETIIKQKEDVIKAEGEIKKNKKQIKKQIDDVIAGEEIETFPPTLEELQEKASEDTGELGYLPSADRAFIRSTTSSEDVNYEGYDANPSPHIVRSRIFLNNVNKFSNRENILAIPFTTKQAESIAGLDKIVRLSYGISEEEYNSEGFDKKAFDDNVNNIATGFVGMLFVEQDPVTKEMFYVDEDGKRINKLGEEIDLTKVIFQTMPTTEVKYSDGSDRYRGKEKQQFLLNAVAWGAARKKMFDDSSANAYKFDISRGIPVVEYDSEDRMTESAVGGGHLATDDEIYSMKGLIEVVTKGFVAFQGQSIKMRKGTTVLKNKDTLVYLNNTKFGKKKAQSVYRVMKALVDEMVQSGKAGKAINLNKQYIAFLKSVMFYKEGATTSSGRFFIDLENMNFIIGNESYPIRNFGAYEKTIVDQLTDTYHSISKETLTKFFEDPFYEFYYENGVLKEREWLNYQTYLLSGKDRGVGEIPLVTTVAKPTEGNPNSFLSKYAVLTDFDLGAQRVKDSDKEQKEPKLPKDKKKPETKEKKQEEQKEYNYEGKLNTYLASFGDIKFTATKDADNNVSVDVNFNENVSAFNNFKDDELAKAKERVVSAQMIEEDENSKPTIVAAYTTMVLNTLLSNQEKASAQAAPEAPVSDIEPEKPTLIKRNLVELENTITDFPLEIQSLFNSPTVEKYENAVGNLELELSADLPSEEYGLKLESQLRDIKKSFTLSKETKPEEAPAPVEKPAPSSGKSFKKKDDPMFREVGELDVERITPEDIEEFKKWHAEKAPFIPYEILDQIYKSVDGVRAWGVFEQGVAKFYKGAQRGTEYHEIFEGIWASFLTPAEQESIIKEERNKRGYFVDRATGKEILYIDGTDKQLKERIADDFADYRLGKLPARNLSERLRRFFKAIIDFFKSFVQKPSLKEDLFKSIDAGKFKESRIPAQVKVLAPEYRAIPGIDETAANLIVEDMIAETARFLFGEDKSLLYNPKKLTGSEVYNNLLDIYSEPDNNRLEVIGEEAFDDLYERMRGFFYSLGVTIPTDEAIEINEGDVNNRNYAPEPFETDWKKNARFAIKFAIATMIKRKNQGQADLSVVKLKGNELQGYQLTPFGRTFSDLLKTLANSNINQFAQKIIKKSGDNPTYKGLMNRLGGDASKGYFPFENFKKDDWRFYIQFFQTFAKQKPEIIIQYMDGGLVYSAEADNFSSVNIIVKDWIETMKQLAKDKSSVIKYNKTNKTYKIDTASKDYPQDLPKNAVDQIKYLEQLGIDFPIEIYRLLKDTPQTGQHKSDKDQFAEAVSTIYEYLKNTDEIGSLTTNVLDVNSSYMTLAKLYSKVTSIEESNVLTNVNGKMMQKYTENNYTSVFENEFNSSKDLADLISKLPQFNDTFSKNSVVLKEGGRFFNPSGKKTRDIKVKVIQGTIDLKEDEGSEISQLAIGQRFSLEINQNLKGNYYIIVPADSSTEWMLNVGNEISFEDSSSDRGLNKLYSIFEGYLKDEINTALDYLDRQELKNTKPEAKQLRMFKDILPEAVVNKVHEMIEGNSSTEDILKYVMDKKDSNEQSVFEVSISNMINSDVDNTLSILKNNGQLVTIPTKEDVEPSYTWESLEISDESKIRQSFYDKYNLSETQVREILTFVNINYAIANIEMHKLLFGDPYQFKSSEDETKRIKSFLSPRRTTFDSVELNNELNKTYNTVNDVVIPIGDLFNHTFKDHTITASLSDVNIFSKAYPDVKINETDGFSIITDGTFREVKIKNAEWSDQAEAWYQWQTAYARQKLSEKGEYTYPKNGALQKADEATLKNPEPDYKLEVLKPIVSGVKYNANTIELVLDKMSQMPIFYKAVEGTAMEKLYLQMLRNKIGYVVYESARKVGVRSMHELYNVEKEFNEAGFSPLTIEKVSWSSYGIQVSNLYEDDKHQTRGSQITKIVSMDMFANGQEAMEGALALYEKNVEMLDMLHENAYNTLLEKLGIVDTGIDFTAPDMVSVAELLTSEILKRDASENLKDSLELVDGQFKLTLEASTDYRKIKDIIYSLVHKSLVSPSMNGRPHVQVPVTLWENEKDGRGLIRKVGEKWVSVSREEYNALSEKEKQGVKLSSNKLKFYTEDQPYMEVLIPYFFKEKLVGKNKKFKTDDELLNYLNTTPEGRSILTGVGFRIPTQAMSSAEVFKVKGFLDPAMGYTVVVPSEITHKAGSDFDIDKLNMYLKSIYIDKDGNPRLVTYKGSEEATKKFYGELYDGSTKARLNRLIRSENFRKNILELFSYSLISQDAEVRPIAEYAIDMPEEMVQFLMDHEDVILEIEAEAFELEMNQYDYYKEQIDRNEKLKGKLTDDQLQKYLKDDYVKRMYKKSLENEYYDTMVKMMQLPDNFKRLLSPVGKANLDNVAKDIIELIGDEADLVKNKLINRNYLTKLRQSFVMGKKWVGIAAVNITGHSLAQKANLFLDTRRLKNVDSYSRSFLGNLSTFLPHNTITVDDQQMISIAGRTTADGKNEFISDRLSGYATAFVDVAKDPYIMSIIRSNSVVGTAMFLERIGAGEVTAYFLNQPIIVNYLRYLDSVQAKGLFSQKNLTAILGGFPTTDEALTLMKEDAKNKTIDTSINHLRENISKYKTNKGIMSVEFNAEQQVIFMEFLKVAKMAQEVFTFTQGYNYDTTKFRNSDSLARKVVRTVKARTNNVINSIDSIFENSFIGDQKDFIDKSMNAMGAIFKLEHPKFRYVKDEVMTQYKEDDYLSQDDYDSIADKVSSSYFDFIIQTNSNIQYELKELTTGNNSVASELPKIQIKHPSIKLLSELTTESSFRPGGAETIRLKVKPELSTEVNAYIGMMRELRALEPEFYNRLVKLAIIQGSQPSYVTILQIIPNEDYAAIVNPIIEALAPSNALDVFYQEAMFQRQNWKDEVAVPTVVKFNYRERSNIYDDEVTYSTEMFGSIPGEPISRRQILLLNPKYNLTDEVVKIPRVAKASIRKTKNTPEGKQTFQETVMIDISKNKPVSVSDIAKSRAKGMFTYDVYYGYKKVKYSDGSPLIDENGNHVYKRINLYGDGVYASEYRLDKEASIFNNGSAPATYEYTKKTVIENPDGTRELIKTVEVIQELDDAQVIAAYGMEMVEEEQVVYSMLGSKTKSENVVIKPWNELKNATRAITPEGIVSTRVKDNYTAHFGNPFTHDKKLIGKGAKLILTNSTRESVQRYIKWILTGETGEYVFDSTMPDPADLDETREWIVEELKSGIHKGKPILYYAELGQPSHATALDYLINEYDWSEQIVPTETEEEAPISTSQKAKQSSRKRTKQTNQLSLFGDETGVAPRLIEVDQYQITVQPNGQMLFANGTEVTDQTIKNKVDIVIATQDGTLKISTNNNSKYFVLSDNRILGSGKTNFGKESVTDPDIQKKILMKAILYKKTC